VQDYRKLDVWKLAHELTLEVYRVTAGFPASESFALTRQLRRSAISVGSNIVEGAGRSSQKELRRFLQIARASCVEAEYQLLVARDLGYLSVTAYRSSAGKADRLRRMLTSLERTVATTKNLEPKT
jgi:four helix bundle protein